MSIRLWGIGLLVIGWSVAAAAQDLTVEFAGGGWDGKAVPDGQQCREFDGEGATPPVTVSGIPNAANAILLEFNDEDYAPLSKDGGHGIVGFDIEPGAGTVTLPGAPGDTTDMPDGIWIEEENRDDIGEAGYLAPCSGGEGNLYSMNVLAVLYEGEEYEVLARGYIQLGRY